MNKNYSIIFGAVSAVAAVFACCLGGLCLTGYISDEICRKQRMEMRLLKETVRQLFYDVNELKLHEQEKK